MGSIHTVKLRYSYDAVTIQAQYIYSYRYDTVTMQAQYIYSYSYGTVMM